MGSSTPLWYSHWEPHLSDGLQLSGSPAVILLEVGGIKAEVVTIAAGDSSVFSPQCLWATPT